MEKLAGQIKKDNALCISDAQKLRSEFDFAIKRIRVRKLKLHIMYYSILLTTHTFQSDENIKAAEINDIYNNLVKAANSQMDSLKKKADAERSAEAEKQRLAKLQIEMERVKSTKDKEERAKLEDEQIKKQLV